MKGKIAFIEAATLGEAFSLCRWLTLKGTRILCYHGGSIGDEYVFNGKLFCPPRLLERRLEWLRAKGFVPSTLAALASNAEHSTSGGILVAVPMDDGWYSSACAF